jgi:membrane-associated phospholipid phosphatase
MKKIYCFSFLFLFLFISNAQSIDSISQTKCQDKISLKHFIAPTVLISGGLLIRNTPVNKNLQEDVQRTLGNDFHTEVDNYLQFGGIAQIYGGRYLGFKPKNDLLHQTINIAVANAIMGGLVLSMKHLIKEERPDHSNHLSFPSGHTATAFTNASLLFYEYKDSNIWYASSGFLFATTTGFLRIANNRHYTSDVLAGAGIGLGVGLVVSYMCPFKSMTFSKNKTHAIVYPQIGSNYGIGVMIYR